MLEHVDADVRLGDELHQLLPRLGDSRNENLVQVRDRYIAVIVSHAIQAVIEGCSLAVHARIIICRKRPANHVHLFGLVSRITSECFESGVGGRVQIYRDLFRAE